MIFTSTHFPRVMLSVSLLQPVVRLCRFRQGESSLTELTDASGNPLLAGGSVGVPCPSRLTFSYGSRASLKSADDSSTQAQLTSQLAASRAALKAEQARRQKLEESLRRIRQRSSRPGSTSSEPGSLADLISPHEVLIGESMGSMTRSTRWEVGQPLGCRNGG